MESRSTFVMAGLDPAIQKKGLDHRVKPGDDKRGWARLEQFQRNWEPVSRPELRQNKELERFG
jgi:hypothetical protein